MKVTTEIIHALQIEIKNEICDVSGSSNQNKIYNGSSNGSGRKWNAICDLGHNLTEKKVMVINSYNEIDSAISNPKGIKDGMATEVHVVNENLKEFHNGSSNWNELCARKK